MSIAAACLRTMGLRRYANRRPRSMTLALCLLLAACGGSGGDGDDCGVEGQNRFVHEDMLERYYWFRRLPKTLDYGRFDSPQQTVEYLRYSKFDRFSYVADRSAFDDLLRDGSYIGYGFSLMIGSDNRAWIRFVYADSPAAAAGIERGDEILRLNGRRVSDILRSEGSLAGALGPSQIGSELSLQVRRKQENKRSLELVMERIKINTVLFSDVIASGDKRIGYLVFNSFLQTSPAELDPVFKRFRDEGVNELILDLRYNGGGSIGVSRDLASYIKPTAANDTDLFLELRYNKKLRQNDFRYYYRKQAQSLGLDEVTIITTQSTCSASEQLISGLRPYLSRVTVVGSRSCGKPVGQNPSDFCDSTLLAVNFVGFNAAGQGDFYDGIPADCSAEDDLRFAFGDPDEPMLKAARKYLKSASCPAVPRAGPAPVETLQGLQAIVGAF